MKDNIKQFMLFIVKDLIPLVIAFIIIFALGAFSEWTVLERDSISASESQNWNDVTFEVIETADSVGNYLIYDTSTGIVYKGGYSAYKPHYSEDGYLYIYRDGRLQEVR